MIVTLTALESDSDRSHGALRNHFEKHSECGSYKKEVGELAGSKRLLYAARAIGDPALFLIVGRKTPHHESEG